MLKQPATPRILPSSGVAGALILPVESPSFRFWLRRSSSSGQLYALRFEVFDGRGVLRVARPGVLVDPPARESGYEGELTLAQVRSSRFLHVSNVDRRRQLHFLSRIPDDLGALLGDEGWVELQPVVDRGAHHLLLPTLAEPIGLSGSTEEPPPILVSGPVESVPSLPPSALTPLAEEDALWGGGRAERREESGAADPAETTPPTSLLRYLRRQLSEVRRENAVLQARVSWLERRLASVDALPMAMDADTADDASEEI